MIDNTFFHIILEALSSNRMYDVKYWQEESISDTGFISFYSYRDETQYKIFFNYGEAILDKVEVD